MMRQIGKQILTIAALLLMAFAARADALVTTIVTDPLTGVAIDGYDAVSYFINTEPQQGSPEYEYIWQGVPWYFANAANRDVFIRSPEIYAPQFGGHCVTSLARGYLSDGKPRLYVIDALKLYFFYSTANRDAFTLSRSASLTSAATNWESLSKGLTGPSADDAGANTLATQPGEADAVNPSSSASAPSTAAPSAPAASSSETPSAASSVAPGG